MLQPIQRSGTSMTARSGIWILLAVGFLANKAFGIRQDLRSGRQITNWDVGVLLLWSVVLCFWTFSLFWDWKRRGDARKVV